MHGIVRLSENRQSVANLRKIGDAEGRRRRLAIQLAAQLPEDPKEAVLVLEAAICLVRTFLADGLG